MPRPGAPIGELRATTGPVAERVLLVLAWIVGALGGVAPVAFVGDPPAGLAAGAVLGATAWWWMAPLVATPWIAAVVGHDDETGRSERFHLAGLSSRRRLVTRSVGATLDVIVATRWAVVAGIVAAAGTGAGAAPAAGLRSAPHLDGMAAGLALLVAAVVVGALLAAAARSRVEAIVAWAVAITLTGSIITAATFVPELRATFALLPWLGPWPFDPDTLAAPTLAIEVAVPTRAASIVAWCALLATVARYRRRHHPFPDADLGGRRPRRRRFRS